MLVALLTAVPFAIAAISTVGSAWHSKRSGGLCQLAELYKGFSTVAPSLV